MQHLTQLKPLNRFTQVPNEAMDVLPDLNSIGLLNVVLRHDASWHFTVDGLVAEKKRIPGPILSRKTAYTAMKTLIAFRWVAKVKFSDGGGHRHTAVFRTVERFTDTDYIQICERYAEGAQLWLHCSHCSDQEGEAVLTRVRGTALLVWAHGEHPVTEVMNSQVAPTVTIPTVGQPAVGGPAVGQPTVGNVTAYKKTSENTSQKKEGEEGGAHARVNQPSVDNSTEWGIAPQARQDPGGSTLFARAVIDNVAHTTGLGLSPSQHRKLVTLLMPVALEVVAALGREDITGGELADWLEWGHDTTQSLYAVLDKRLDPAFLAEHLPAWVDAGRRPTPSPSPRPAQRPQGIPGAPHTPPGDPPRVRRCPVHKTVMLADPSGHGWKCLECEREEPPPRPTPPAPAPKTPMPWEAEPEPAVPEHCGQCHASSRHRIRFDDHAQGHVDLGPCPTCHPTDGTCPRCRTHDHATPGAA